MAVCPWVVFQVTDGFSSHGWFLCVQQCTHVRAISGNPNFTDRSPPHSNRAAWAPVSGYTRAWYSVSPSV